MRTFAVTHNNDLLIGADGNLAFRKGQAAAVLVCEHYARAARGEMIHKMDRGMPFWPVAFGPRGNLAQFEAAFRARMREIPQVVAVVEFSAQIAEERLKYEATIDTIFGRASLSDG